MKIGFIGAGNMGSALAKAAKEAPKCEIYIYDTDTNKGTAVANELSARFCENKKIAEVCDFIFLAVKPKFIRSVIEEIGPVLKINPNSVLVSMAAGVKISAIEDALGFEMPIIRIMPNTPVAVGSGVVLAAKNKNVFDVAFASFKSILASAGDIIPMEEELIDAGTAVSGCSPAFVFMFIDALARGGANAGISEGLSRELAAKTLIGAAKLLLAGEKEPEELCRAVCSPGGSTIEGVNFLKENGFAETVSAAVMTSYKKTVELGK